MADSRKHSSRGKLKRRRQLRQVYERNTDEEKKKKDLREPAFIRFFKKRVIELLFVAVLVIGIFFVKSLGPDKKAMNTLRESVSSLLLEYAWEWDELYPNGYKVISLSDQNIIHTTYDTLPKALKIDWNKVSIERIQDKQLTSIFEKIRIKMSNINYAPGEVKGLSVSTAMVRQKGATSTIARLGDLNLIVKIVEDTGDQVFCLFALL